jgi:hypothetical protein
MKKGIGLLSLVLFVLLGCADQACAQDITAEEREFLVNHLHRTRAKLVEATKGLTTAQWHFKPSPFKWSAAQLLEHISLVEDHGIQLVKYQVANAPAPPPRDQAAMKAGDKHILDGAADQSNKKYHPSEPIRPEVQTAANKTPNDPAADLKRFLDGREKTIEFSKTGKDMRGHCMDSPPLKCSDVYQWLLLISAHSERHTVQLLELKANPNFPKH